MAELTQTNMELEKEVTFYRRVCQKHTAKSGQLEMELAKVKEDLKHACELLHKHGGLLSKYQLANISLQREIESLNEQINTECNVD